MRCFIAIGLPKEIKDYLYDLQKSLRDLPAKIKWIPKGQQHVTLKFLGEVSENKLEEIKKILAKIKFKSFKVKLSEIGVFPSKNFIRVIWVGLKPAGKVIELQQRIDSELLEFFSKDQRFSSHLTIGRVKFIKKKEDFIKKLEEVEIEEKEFCIGSFKLMKSTLTKDGPIYEVLEEFKS